MDANKAVGAGVAGAATVILAWILHQFFHLEVPAEVASAVTALFSTGAAYMIPHSEPG